MIASATIATVISTYGLAVLAPLAVLEGPIVTIVAAYLVRIGLLPLWPVILCVIFADVVGDGILYGIGRGMLNWLPLRFRARLGVSDDRLANLAHMFREKGIKVLVFGKLTHVAGFAVLIGAGAAKMPFGPFILTNLLATIPKSLALIAAGYVFGGAHVLISHWFSTGSVAILAALVCALAIWRYRKLAVQV